MFDDGTLTTPSGHRHPVNQRRKTPTEARRLLADYIVGHCASCGGPIFEGDRAGSPDSDWWHTLCALTRSEAPISFVMATVRDLYVQAGLQEPPATEVRALALRVLNHPDNSHPLPELQAALRRQRLAEALSDDFPAIGPITTAVRGLDPEAWRP